MSIMDPASKFICNKRLAFSMSHGPSIYIQGQSIVDVESLSYMSRISEERKNAGKYSI